MKIFKLFVCIALILSISLINSFAAISVSDGSAFVTKAEFAADLNNLSNRMSTLENSLDAKIDSLVSSYLSRNGIWNGEKQTISNYWKYNSSGQINTTIPKAASTITTESFIYVAPNVFTATKSGLLFAHFGVSVTNGYTNKYTFRSVPTTEFNRTSNTKDVNLFSHTLSVSISPVGSKWLGDYDGTSEKNIAYQYITRTGLNAVGSQYYSIDMQGFVQKSVSYSIYIAIYAIDSAIAVRAFYSTSYRGLDPYFYIY